MHDQIIFFRFILKQQKTIYSFCKETVSVYAKVGAMGHYRTNAGVVIMCGKTTVCDLINSER